MEESRHVCLDAARHILTVSVSCSAWTAHCGEGRRITEVGSEDGLTSTQPPGIGPYRTLFGGHLDEFIFKLRRYLVAGYLGNRVGLRNGRVTAQEEILKNSPGIPIQGCCRGPNRLLRPWHTAIRKVVGRTRLLDCAPTSPVTREEL